MWLPGSQRSQKMTGKSRKTTRSPGSFFFQGKNNQARIQEPHTRFKNPSNRIQEPQTRFKNPSNKRAIHKTSKSLRGCTSGDQNSSYHNSTNENQTVKDPPRESRWTGFPIHYILVASSHLRFWVESLLDRRIFSLLFGWIYSFLGGLFLLVAHDATRRFPR